MNVVLCGMMGCGKTTVANILEKNYGMRRVDTDELIVERYGEINQIFSEHGEPYFRDVESSVVQALSESCDRTVISVGGGCVLRRDNVQALKKRGKIIYLRATAATLIGRLRGDASRPLLQGNIEERVQTILDTRSQVYESVADYSIDTDGLMPEQIADTVMELIK